MSNEQDPMPKMQASQDDIALRQKQLQQRRIAAQRAAKTRPASSEQIIAPAPKQTVAIVALLLSLAMAGFAGFLFMQLQEANAQLQKAAGPMLDSFTHEDRWPPNHQRIRRKRGPLSQAHTRGLRDSSRIQ